jgi:hypothetical protein
MWGGVIIMSKIVLYGKRTRKATEGDSRGTRCTVTRGDFVITRENGRTIRSRYLVTVYETSTSWGETNEQYHAPIKSMGEAMKFVEGTFRGKWCWSRVRIEDSYYWKYKSIYDRLCSMEVKYTQKDCKELLERMNKSIDTSLKWLSNAEVSGNDDLIVESVFYVERCLEDLASMYGEKDVFSKGD